MRRWITACLLAIVATSIVSPVTCAGWEARASERMACCQRAEHDDCDDQRAADDCCAGAEQRDQPGTSSIADHAGSLPYSGAVIATPFESVPDAATIAHVVHLLTPPASPPPDFFGPPLRI